MKISVIIPVYNVEKYLRECLDSVINQTYKDLEIICVNDASTDSSLSILEEYALKDSRIKVFNNDKRLNPGSSRNLGVKYATGEYIHFLDSDDWLELDAYEKLVNHLEKIGNVDVLHFLWNYYDNVDKTFVSGKYKNTQILNKIVNINDDKDFFVNWCRSAWLKLYRKDFLINNKLFFNDYPCLEDIEYGILILVFANSIYFVDDVLLNYRVNNKYSLMGKYYKYYEFGIRSFNNTVSYLCDVDIDSQREILSMELAKLLNMLEVAYNHKVIRFNEYKELVKSINYSVFGKDLVKYSWYPYYNGILNDIEFVYCLKSFIRKFLKKYMYSFYLFMLNLRKKYLFLRRI